MTPETYEKWSVRVGILLCLLVLGMIAATIWKYYPR